MREPAKTPAPGSAWPEVAERRCLIRHATDVPVLLSALACGPDWVLTHNTKHSTPAVARRAKLRIGTPAEFFRTLSSVAVE